MGLHEKLGFLLPTAKVRSPGPSSSSLSIPQLSWLFVNGIFSWLSTVWIQEGKGTSGSKHIQVVQVPGIHVHAIQVSLPRLETCQPEPFSPFLDSLVWTIWFKACIRACPQSKQVFLESQNLTQQFPTAWSCPQNFPELASPFFCLTAS